MDRKRNYAQEVLTDIGAGDEPCKATISRAALQALDLEALNAELVEELEQAEIVLNKMHGVVSRGELKFPFGNVAPTLDKVRAVLAKAKGE